MKRLLVAPQALAYVVVAWLGVGCTEAPSAPPPRPNAPDGGLFPVPRSVPGQPIDSSAPTLKSHPVAIAVFGIPTTLKVGASATLSAMARDSSATAMTDVVPAWSVSDTTAAKIDAKGVLTALRVAPLQVGALVGDTTAWFPVTVVAASAPATPATPAGPAPVAPPVPAGPPTPSSVGLSIVRFDGQPVGAGAVTVSNGVPLLPGALMPGQDGAVHVLLDGVEQPAYVASLAGLHPDGSVRAVLVQFTLPVGASGAATLTIGAPRDTTYVLAAPLTTPGTTPAGVPAGVPAAAALPTDPAYLIATDLVGPTTPAAANAALGGAFARYESDFVKYSAVHWNADGAGWAGDYYDRVLIYYAMWVRTGDPTYWARAGQIARDYRTKYLEPNAYGSSPHWSQLEGLEKHYLLTGEEASRVAVVKTAAKLQLGFLNPSYMTAGNGESRIAARLLHSQLLAWRLTTPWLPAISGAAGQATWGANVEKTLAMLVAWQAPDGSWPAQGQVCGGQLNYMVGQLNDALIKTYDYYVPAATSRAALQSTIRTLVTNAVDYMWTTQWIPAKSAFQYASVDCSSKNVGGPSPAPDLNNMITAGFGWVYRQTGDPKYLAAGDQIFVGGVTQAFVAGTKQFNEEYTSSFRYLAYR